VLKCDIKKFFASVDQGILMEIIQSRILDPDIVWLIGQVVSSFYSTEPSRGLPLGNLTSQLLVNVYMNEFDQFMKHRLKARYYIRAVTRRRVLRGIKQSGSKPEVVQSYLGLLKHGNTRKLRKKVEICFKPFLLITLWFDELDSE
jgi:retron-type reverse transcriptase